MEEGVPSRKRRRGGRARRGMKTLMKTTMTTVL